MTAILVGNDAAVGGETPNMSVTWLDKNVPSNGTGKITEIKVYSRANANLTALKFGLFYGAALSWACRSAVDLGAPAVTIGVNTFSGLALDVVTGDLLGVYFVGAFPNTLGSTAGGVAVCYIVADKVFPAGAENYTAGPAYITRMYGTGNTPAITGGHSGKLFVGGFV